MQAIKLLAILATSVSEVFAEGATRRLIWSGVLIGSMAQRGEGRTDGRHGMRIQPLKREKPLGGKRAQKSR